MPSSRRAGRDPTILSEDFGEVTALAQRRVQRAFEHCLFDHATTPIDATTPPETLARKGDCYRRPMPPRPGLSATADLVVTEADTAMALNTGDVPVLATPRVVRLAEEASVRSIDGTLAEGTTSVGYRVQLDHLAPTAVGGKVRAEATLEMIEGRRLTFRVSVSDGHGLVAAGRITRVIVERTRFLEKAAGA